MVEKELCFGAKGINVVYKNESQLFTINANGKEWFQDKGFKPYIEVYFNNDILKLLFSDAAIIEKELFKNGIGEGIRLRYSEFRIKENVIPVEFETLVWVDCTFGELHFEFIPLREMKGLVRSVVWPAPIRMAGSGEPGYSVLPLMQGVLLPGNWENEIDIGKIADIENGKFYSRSSYMPWWGQVEGKLGYMAIAETPWDGGYFINHPAGGPTTIGSVWSPSLGAVGYKRIIKYIFTDCCDYNKLCKIYREYVSKKGNLVTLNEKAIKNRNVRRLIGSPIVHTFIYNHVEPESLYYDKENPEKNDELVTFYERASQLDELKSKGIDNAFIHVDGWGNRGYDNQHPDIFPPCEKAGGWNGMKLLSDTCKKNGYIFATHDQYRDYYLDAETYDSSQTIRDIKGQIPYECIWNGGKQSVLCTQLATHYIARNFENLKRHGVELEGTYLDVFSVIGLDECDHYQHRMTRKECMEKRAECFNYVRSEGIIASSEETVDWAVPTLDLSYRSNYVLQPSFNKGLPVGIPIPLFNLVYHDCVVVPWFLRIGGYEIPEGEDGMLHALLNGDTCYLDIEAGNEEIESARVVWGLHKKVGTYEMVKHEFIDGAYKKQRTTFADGTIVEVDFETGEYNIR